MAFTDTVLANAQLKAEEWMPTTKGFAYRPRVEALKMIIAEQTAKVTDYFVRDKKRGASINWLKSCGITATAYDDDCTPAGASASSVKADYALTLQNHAGFEVSERVFDDNVFDKEDAFIVGKLAARKALLEILNARVHTVLGTLANYSVVNAALLAELGYSDDADDIVEIPAHKFTADLFHDFAIMARESGMNDPCVVTGRMLEKLIQSTALNVTDPTGESAAKKVALIRNYIDPTMDTTLTFQRSFIVDRGTFALLNDTLFKNTDMGPEVGGRHRWTEGLDIAQGGSVKEPNLEGDGLGLNIDMIMVPTCATGTDMSYVFDPLLLADVIKAPLEGCEAANTGIIALKCV